MNHWYCIVCAYRLASHHGDARLRPLIFYTRPIFEAWPMARHLPGPREFVGVVFALNRRCLKPRPIWDKLEFGKSYRIRHKAYPNSVASALRIARRSGSAEGPHLPQREMTALPKRSPIGIANLPSGRTNSSTAFFTPGRAL
jgi:hypothetical protein